MAFLRPAQPVAAELALRLQTGSLLARALVCLLYDHPLGEGESTAAFLGRAPLSGAGRCKSR